MKIFINLTKHPQAIKIRRHLPLLLVVLLLCGCSASGKGCLAPAGSPSKSVYALKIGDHTGLMFKATDLDQSQFPELSDLPKMKFYKIGWGDFDYYQNPSPSAWLGLKALFWPTDAAIHLVGVEKDPEQILSGAELVELPMTEEAFRQVSNYVSSFFERKKRAAAKPTQTGFYPKSFFYPAKGTFYFLNTCNTWTAQALNAGGCSFTPLPITAGSFFNQIKQINRKNGY